MKPAVVVSTAVLFLASSALAQQKPAPQPPTITVNGEATIAAEPDHHPS